MMWCQTGGFRLLKPYNANDQKIGMSRKGCSVCGDICFSMGIYKYVFGHMVAEAVDDHLVAVFAGYAGE